MHEQRRAFLDVTASLTGRRWIGPAPEDTRLAEAMAQETHLPLPLCLTLVRRGVTAADAPGFLAPALRDLLPDPMVLRDMGLAADRFLHAVRTCQRIAIFADYDVDGGSSAALLICWLRAMGRAATLYIPDRIDEGYGPNVPAMQALGAAHDLIVAVDCGTLSHEPIAAAGCDVVVLDHHLGGEVLPPALAVVNPNRQDEDGALGHLCAAGVVRCSSATQAAVGPMRPSSTASSGLPCAMPCRARRSRGSWRWVSRWARFRRWSQRHCCPSMRFWR